MGKMEQELARVTDWDIQRAVHQQGNRLEEGVKEGQEWWEKWPVLPQAQTKDRSGVGPWPGRFLIPSQIQRGSKLVTHMGVFPAPILSRQDLEGQRRVNSSMGNIQESQSRPAQMIRKCWPWASCHLIPPQPKSRLLVSKALCVHMCVYLWPHGHTWG